MKGIGDTIRVSLASDPIDEVKVGWEMLKSLKIRSRGVKIVACPSCSRQNFQVIDTVNKLENELSELKEEVTLAVIGCYVNGPGESKVADVGVTGATPKHLIYLNGKPAYKVETKDNTKIVHLDGEIDMEVADKARQTILPLIEAGHDVDLNLSKVTYMDSSGISVLIESHQKANELGTKVILKEISKSVLKVIMMAKLEQILNLE